MSSDGWGFTATGELWHAGKQTQTNIDFRTNDIVSIALNMEEYGPAGKGTVTIIRLRERQQVLLAAFSGLSNTYSGIYNFC